ncbi:MAG: hypothetical protein JOY69_06940 [Candidatus Eremiobacteraeota bacterium]|nr:hypothetical protein [Candidatus Eremiobacteraeota bacterium]
MSALFAALWLLGLLAAAPMLRTETPYGFTDRLRDAIILGVAIPFALAFVHALYPLTCWLALAACVAVASRRPQPHVILSADRRTPPYLLVAALALVAWPQLMRPLLDGDSLSYHLPNAAAWVHAHSLWTTDPRYWWYPPGSELFASGLFAVSGPFSLGWSGFGALALLGFRLVDWARDEFAAPPWLADALAAATVTVAPLALQGGTLQNDVWLAAFFLEALWTLRRAPAANARTLAVTVLLKPYGWLFATIAALASKAPRSAWLAAAGIFALWVVHDVVLWHAAILAPASASSGNTWQSTILAHGLPGLALLVRVALLASPFALLALFAAVVGPFVAGASHRALGWAAVAAAIAFLLMPLAYADWRPQLETGASLRYAAPAIALGALMLARPATLAPRISFGLLIVSTLFGAASVLATYWNDGGTRTALAIALIAIGNVVLARRMRADWPLVAGFAVAVVVAGYLTARHPLDYYVDAQRVGGKASALYAWIAREQPRAVGGWGLRLGIVNVLSPSARAIDLPDRNACATARREYVPLVAVAETDRPDSFNALRLSAARGCGPVLFDDGVAVVAEPR